MGYAASGRQGVASQVLAFAIGILALGISTQARAATLTLSDGTGNPSQVQVAMPLSLALGSGEQISALSWDIRFDPAVSQFQSVVLDPAITALGKQVAANTVAPGQIRILIYGLDRQVFTAGQIGQCLFSVAATAALGSSIVDLQNGLSSNPNGGDATLLLADGRLWVVAPPDTVAPQISAVAVSAVTQTGATVTWTTDELSTSQVEYGATTAYGSTTLLDSTLTLAHSVALSGLTAGTQVHLRVASADAASNRAVSGDVVFTTLAPPAVSTPVLSPAGGTFSGSVTVTLSTATSGATLRYTLDGSDPTAASTAYAQPIVLNATTTVKARAFKSGMSDSAVASGTFTLTSATGVELSATQASAASDGWWTVGSERVCWDAGKWLEYSINFGTGGTWTINMTATNQNNSLAPNLPPGYTFNVSVSVDGAYKGMLMVPGSTTSYLTGSLPLTMPSGTHAVRFTWTNDTWVPGLYDANLRVRSVSFVPAAAPVVPGPYTFTGTQAQAASSGWTISGTDRYSWNANQWFEYQSVDFGPGGNWLIGASAINQTNTTAPGLPAGYTFDLDLYVDGTYKATLQVPGSTTTYQTGSKTIAIASGRHAVRLVWTNDLWVAGQYDANLRVRNVTMVKQ